MTKLLLATLVSFTLGSIAQADTSSPVTFADSEGNVIVVEPDASKVTLYPTDAPAVEFSPLCKNPQGCSPDPAPPVTNPIHCGGFVCK